MRKRFSRLTGVAVAVGLVLTACGSNDDSGSAGDTVNEGESTVPATVASSEGTTVDEPSTEVSTGTEVAGPCPGTQGCTPEFPDGDITIGILSGGDTNDNGYWESFVTSATNYSDEQGWEAIIVDRVAPADAAEQARNLCRQGASFIGVADQGLVDALAVAEEDVCEGVVFYINDVVELTPYVYNSTDNIGESALTSGYATGLVMKQLGVDSAAFISGPELDFVTESFNGWTAGIKQAVPEATTSKTLTGDFDDSALGQEAASAQIAAGAGMLYPYLGGATDAVAQAGLDADVLSVAPGTDRCDDPAFAVSTLYPPGEYLLLGIKAWQNGTAKMGESTLYSVGVDPYPSAKICESVENSAELQAELDAFMAGIASGDIDVEGLLQAG